MFYFIRSSAYEIYKKYTQYNKRSLLYLKRQSLLNYKKYTKYKKYIKFHILYIY